MQIASPLRAGARNDRIVNYVRKGKITNSLLYLHKNHHYEFSYCRNRCL